MQKNCLVNNVWARVLLSVALTGIMGLSFDVQASMVLPDKKPVLVSSEKAIPFPEKKPAGKMRKPSFVEEVGTKGVSAGGTVVVASEGDSVWNIFSSDAVSAAFGIFSDDVSEGETGAEEENSGKKKDINTADNSVSDSSENVAVRTFGHVVPTAPGKKPMPDISKNMSSKNAEIYNKIFAAQSVGDFKKADLLFESLTDFRLRGHVLYQRYMHPTLYRSSYDELAGWMNLYASYSGASKIYRVALSKETSKNSIPLKRPETVKGINGYLESRDDISSAYKSARRRSRDEQKKVSSIASSIRKAINHGSPEKAWAILSSSENGNLFDNTEFDIMRGNIAYGFLHKGNNEQAFYHARAAVSRSGNKVPLGGWVNGLIEWKSRHYENSAKYFEIAASSPYASGWTLSAAAYWASRAHMRTGNYRAVSYWLQKSAMWPRTFYGIIATRALGRNYLFNWEVPDFTEKHKKILNGQPAARRAMLLLQAGQVHSAEMELRQIPADKSGEMETALLAYALHKGLPSFAMRLANAIPHPDGGFYDSALYPIAPWKPKSGYKIDLALLHAVIRQESRFDPGAENRSGATGLMQLMPATASYVEGKRSFKGKDGRHRLKDPLLNVEIGQNYIEDLINSRNIDGDLFSLAIAYNAGPGNLAKWQSRLSGIDDPLLFVESIPVAETRAYVERVLSNYWIYRMRLGQPVPSLDDVASGNRPMYKSMDHAKTYVLSGVIGE